MSKSSSLIFWCLLLVASTVAVGVVHGRLTQRWGVRPDMIGAARQLEKVPEVAGDWKMVSNDKLDPKAAEMLQCTGQLNRIYQNDKTGDRISVFVILGPMGPTAAHTPDICYSSRDYDITRERQVWKIDLPDNSSHDFWDLRLAANNLDKSPLRTVYAWTNSLTWEAPSSPRFKYGGSPYLYKVQVAGPPPKDEEDGKNYDACRDFLMNFLPQLREHMLSP